MASGDERPIARPISWRPRLSVANLLLIIVIAAFGASHVALNRRWAADKAELEQLRDVAGNLTVSDRSKLHAIGVPTFGKHKWKWHVHLPDDREYQLHLVTGGVPARDVPESRGSLQVRSGFYSSGEMLLTVEITKAPEGAFILSAAFPHGRLSQPIEFGDWVNRGHSRVAIEPGRTIVVEPDQPMILLKMLEDQGAGGIMVYIDEFHEVERRQTVTEWDGRRRD